MEKISIFIVLIVSLFIPDASCGMCSMNKYYEKGTGCVECPACGPGKQFTTNCGYNNAGERTSAAQCEQCWEGVTFKAQLSSDACDNCQLCKNGKIKKKECTLTSNTVCECPQGTYEYHGVCRPVLTKAPVTAPLTTPKITTAALPVTTANATTTAQISTQTNELPKDEPIIQVQRKMVMIFITY
ncbi:tumor necrosis factor receptor superfamily member 27-like [Orbicella faveolata]|uniref:tumor necrosis factor receptor superfamily member 27-like n=1 Tax=Orbicella faveolata TaxID=48498 RepID=UPI0009E384B7|nr:tumor necrosis factor receptor superfamily member 27-like [Orbicella faveolata]